MFGSVFDWMVNNLVTISSLVIVLVFIAYFVPIIRIMRYKKLLEKISHSSDILDSIIKSSRISRLGKNYMDTIVFMDNDDKMRTDENAEDFFNINDFFNQVKINQRLISSGAGMLVGLGLLGTFLGLTIGVKSFDSSSTEMIKNSINSLLGGMGTAFITSLIGMTLSSIYILCEKCSINALSRKLEGISDTLDDLYYISQPQKYKIIQDKQFEMFQQQSEKMLSFFRTTDENGNVVTLTNLVRGVFEESGKQSTALNNFTEELFPQEVNNALNANLQPLVDGITNVTDTLSEKLEAFAKSVQSPGENMADGIVVDLKAAIGEMLAEFKNNVADLTSKKMDGFSEQLNIAAVALSSFPERMNQMSVQMSTNFKTVADLSSSIEDGVKRMNNQLMSQTSASTSEISKLTIIMENTIKTLNEKTKEVNESILNRQNETQNQSDILISNLNKSVSDIDKLMLNISSIILEFNKFNDNAIKNTTNMYNIFALTENNIRTLKESQQSLIEGLSTDHDKMDKIILDLNSVISGSQSLSKDSLDKFTQIRDSLKTIFDEINTGVNQYSQTVKASSQSLLESYTNSSNKAIEQLSSAIDQLGDELGDFIDLLPTKH